MGIEDVIVPGLSAAGGASLMGIVMKFLLKSWLDRHDEMAKAVSAMTVQMVKFETLLGHFSTTDSTTRRQDVDIGKLYEKVERVEKDIHHFTLSMHRGP